MVIHKLFPLMHLCGESNKHYIPMSMSRWLKIKQITVFLFMLCVFCIKH